MVVALKGADDGEGEIEKVNSVAIPSLAAKLGVGRGDVRCFSSSLYTLGISCKKRVGLIFISKSSVVPEKEVITHRYVHN